MLGSPRCSARRVLPLLLIGAIPGCGDSGTASTVSASATQGSDPTLTSAPSTGPGEVTETATSAPTSTPTSTPTEGSATAGETLGTTAAPGTSTGTTAVGETSTGGTTTPVDPSDATTASSSGDDGTTAGMKLDMGPQPCEPDLTPTTYDFIWIANTGQGTVSKIDTLHAANCGVDGRIQAVG